MVNVFGGCQPLMVVKLPWCHGEQLVDSVNALGCGQTLGGGG